MRKSASAKTSAPAGVPETFVQQLQSHPTSDAPSGDLNRSGFAGGSGVPRL